MKWLKRIGIALAALLALLACAPWFITLNDYIPTLEQRMGEVLKEPVKIGSLHVSAFPLPHARIEALSVGRAADIKVAKLAFTPALSSLLASQKVIRSVDIDGLVLSQKAFGTLLALTKPTGKPSAWRVENIRLRDATVRLEHSSFGPFDVQVRLQPVGPGEFRLTTRDGALKASATPDGEGYALHIAAKAWTLPAGPAIRFDALEIKGLVRGSEAQLDEIAGKLYGGTLAGRSVITWRDGVGVKGTLDLKQIELRHAVALVSKTTRVSGRLDAKPAFRSRASTFAQLDEALRIETPFAVHDGVLYGFDLQSAASSFGQKGTSGGQTRFEELTGQLGVDRRVYRFTQLKIASGALSARGHVTISATRALEGQLSTSVKPLGRTASIPLTVAGTLDSPLVYPNGAALAGAAAGTAVLGPGLGTAAGAKLGEFVDNLIGKISR